MSVGRTVTMKRATWLAGKKPEAAPSKRTTARMASARGIPAPKQLVPVGPDQVGHQGNGPVATVSSTPSQHPDGQPVRKRTSMLRRPIALYQKMRATTLVSNSIFLMLSSGINAALGFIFWIIVARSSAPASIGIATTLIGLSVLVGFIGLIGIDIGLVRFLAHSKSPSEYVSSALTVTAVTTGVASLFVGQLLAAVSPKLAFVFHDTAFLPLFIVTNISNAWNSLTNNVFVSVRQTGHIVWINVAAGLAKIGVLAVFKITSWLAIFGIYALGQIVNDVLSLVVIVYVFHHHLKILAHPRILRPTVSYSLGTYVGNVLYWLPTTLMPLIVLSLLGAKQAAYFYVAFTIVAVLFTIPSSSMLSLFAEGSHDPASLSHGAKKAIVISWALLAPCIVAIGVFGGLILSLYGHQYQEGAGPFLILFSMSSFLVTLVLCVITIFRVTLNWISVIAVSAVFACATLGISISLIPELKLNGVGIAWMVGCIMAVAAGWLLLRTREDIPTAAGGHADGG